MNGKVDFILGVHNHLPNGTSDDEFETLYNTKIRPLVSALYQFPRINVVLHYSGVLFHWIERRHPELFVLIEDLLSRKQVELLGGGFYEPMMPLLPLTDKIGQIEMLTTYLRRQFGKRPQGCLLPVHAWEQNLVVPLGSCGMNYTFLDEACFTAAGASVRNAFFHEPCITEDQGKIITVFPVYSSLDSIKPAAMLEKLNALPCDSPGGPVTVFPVFDINPGVKAETEFQHFFEELSAADPQIEFTTPSRIYRNLRGLKKLYFSGSHYTAGDTALPPRQFLTVCPEAGAIYAKMIHTRLLVNQLRGDKARKHSALEELLKAQDSALFTPEGLSNTAVRKAAYCALLEADKITRESHGTPSLSVFDYDLDGEDEYVFQDEKLNCYVKATGAYLFELDYLPGTCNFLDTFVTGNSGSQERKRRGAFTEYLVPGAAIPALNWQGVNGAHYCGNETFENVKCDRVHKQAQFRLAFPADSSAANGEFPRGMEMLKTWYLKRNIISLQYEIKNSGNGPLDFFLIPSVDLSFSGRTAAQADAALRIVAIRNARETITSDQAELTVPDLRGLEFQDMKNEVVLSLECTRTFTAGIFMVDSSYICLMPVLPIKLEKGKNLEIGFSVRITP